jgi:hypothetical protein
VKAVEVRQLAGLGEELYRRRLDEQGIWLGGPLADLPSGGKHNDGPRALFAGAMAIYRNPAGHRDITYEDQAESRDVPN